MSTEITELLYVSREPAWAPWAVQYFFLIGLSFGSFLLTLPGIAFGRATWWPLGRAALLGALVCGIVAPVALISDLNQPGRFLNFYLHPATSSWMAWGAFFIPAYVGALAVYALVALGPDFAEAAASGGPLAPVRRFLAGPARPRLLLALGLVTLVCAFTVALYTGVEVMVVRARPLWNTALLPWQFAATALAGSLGLAMLLARFALGAGAAIDGLANRLLAVSLAAVVLIGAAWFALAFFAPNGSEGRALAQVSGSMAWRTSAIWLAAACVVPLVIALLRPHGSGLVTGLLALNGAWLFRWTIFVGGQEMPKTGAGLHAHPLALGPEGLLGIVGTAGLWLAVAVALTILVPWSGSVASTRPSTSPQGA